MIENSGVTPSSRLSKYFLSPLRHARATPTDVQYRLLGTHRPLAAAERGGFSDPSSDGDSIAFASHRPTVVHLYVDHINKPLAWQGHHDFNQIIIFRFFLY